ncbi:hypothetical protein ISO29_12105 [Staphylococcus haemolyticus]|nr:hypothetical protein [Staphylococcus haemolyticus]MBF2774809.1 hypothetical protein [Staphylococcus haemolyticus]MBF2777096.1 hypothetical protein [Staphylococcus haemolyticus]MBF2816690.1 hypothetical protein [Staphylococcus haemolyticus]MBF9721225.1 hypothetical protein [Staphylococcus haemolyticus]
MNIEKIKKIVANAMKFYDQVNKKKQEMTSGGLTDNQIIMQLTDDYDFVKSKINNLLKNGFKDSTDVFMNQLKEGEEFLVNFKKYLASDGDEKLEELVSKIIELNIIKSKELQNQLDEEEYIKLVSFPITMGLKVTKITYQYAKDKFDRFGFISRVKDTVQNYTISVVKFLKEDIKIQEYSTEILDFTFGNKPRAIISTLFKLSSHIFNKDINNKFEEAKIDLNKEFDKNSNMQNINNKEIEQKKYEKENNPQINN